MRASSQCQYCGGPATAWCGEYSWCLSERCIAKYCRDTYTPLFALPPSRPTLFEGAFAWVMVIAYGVLAKCVRASWIIEQPETSWRYRIAVAVYANSYYWDERLFQWRTL